MSKSASSEKEIPTSSSKSTSNDRLEVLKEKESVVNQSSISSTSITKCGTEKKSKTYSAAKSSFLKTWGWAIGDLEDFESEPNGIINSTSDIKPSSSSNESEGEFFRCFQHYIVLHIRDLYEMINECLIYCRIAIKSRRQ